MSESVLTRKMFNIFFNLAVAVAALIFLAYRVLGAEYLLALARTYVFTWEALVALIVLFAVVHVASRPPRSAITAVFPGKGPYVH